VANAEGGARATLAALEHRVGVRELVLALSAGLFAFGGWHMVTYAAGETREAARTIPRALLIGVTIVTLCYVGLNAAYLVVLPLAQVQQSVHVAADAAEVLGGPIGATLVSALVIVSAFGAANGIVLAGPRVYYAMARDGLLFQWTGAIHSRFRTPHLAIAAQAIWVSALIVTGSYRALFTRVIYTEWIFFGLMAIGLVRLRRRADYAPRYRLWGYPIVPLLFIIASLVVVLAHVAADPVESLSGLLLVATGWPVYWWWTRMRVRRGGLAHVRD
jgi:basic amino acid/polyamine antiporter, APA family